MVEVVNGDERSDEVFPARSAIDVSGFTASLAAANALRSAIDVSGFTASSAAMLAEIVKTVRQDPSLRVFGPAEVAPRRFHLTEADRRSLHRAAVFIVVGILVILARELTPKASAEFGAWLGITGGLTALIWYLMDQNKQS